MWVKGYFLLTVDENHRVQQEKMDQLIQAGAKEEAINKQNEVAFEHLELAAYNILARHTKQAVERVNERLRK